MRQMLKSYARSNALGPLALAVLAVLAVLALLPLAACSRGTPGASGAPSATTAATPVPPTPTNVPAGWRVYTATYFSIAYPPGWTVTPNQQATAGRPPGSIAVNYGFDSSDHRQSFIVGERDQLTQTELHTMCFGDSESRPATVAGLPMLYYHYPISDVYTFITSQSVAYSLQYTAPSSETQSITLYMQAFNTFRPLYTTSACK